MTYTEAVNILTSNADNLLGYAIEPTTQCILVLDKKSGGFPTPVVVSGSLDGDIGKLADGLLWVVDSLSIDDAVKFWCTIARIQLLRTVEEKMKEASHE